MPCRQRRTGESNPRLFVSSRLLLSRWGESYRAARSDAVRLGRQHIRDGLLSLRQDKNRQRCPYFGRIILHLANSLYWPGKLRRRNQNKARAGFGTYNHDTLCVISALVSCGWWAAPAEARLFFRCIFSGGRPDSIKRIFSEDNQRHLERKRVDLTKVTRSAIAS